MPPRNCEGLAGSNNSVLSVCHLTGARDNGLRDKPKRFNHRNEYDVNPSGICPISIFTFEYVVLTSVTG